MTCKKNGQHRGPCSSRCNPEIPPRSATKDKRYQIIIQERPGDPWRFAAHGAVYSGNEGDGLIQLVKGNGKKVRKLKV
jgi:hypothetical protein